DWSSDVCSSDLLHGASGKENGERGEQVVDARVHGEDDGGGDAPRERQRAIAPAHESPQTGDLDGGAQWQQGEDFRGEERPEGQADVAAVATDVFLEFQEREAMLDVPDQIRHKEQETQHSGERDPAVEQMLTLDGEREPGDE